MGLSVFVAMHTFSFLRTLRNNMLLASSPETKNSCSCLGHFPGCSFLYVWRILLISQPNIEEGDWIPTILFHQHSCSCWRVIRILQSVSQPHGTGLRQRSATCTGLSPNVHSGDHGASWRKVLKCPCLYQYWSHSDNSSNIYKDQTVEARRVLRELSSFAHYNLLGRFWKYCLMPSEPWSWYSDLIELEQSSGIWGFIKALQGWEPLV